MIDAHHGWNLSFKPQFIGFTASFILLVAVHRIVTHYELTSDLLNFTIVGLALGQALIQLFFFFHVGLETKPHWSLITFLFTILVILIIVFGSMWIMSNLNYDLMPSMKPGGS